MQIEGRNVTWLLELFLRELPNYYASINQAISEKDATALYLAVHKLRGASVSLGAQRIVKLCKHLEKSSKNNAFEDAARYAVMLEMEMQLTQQEIEKQKK